MVLQAERIYTRNRFILAMPERPRGVTTGGISNTFAEWSAGNAGTMSYLGALSLLFIGLKLSGYIHWSWWLVLSPLLPSIFWFAVIFWASWQDSNTSQRVEFIIFISSILFLLSPAWGVALWGEWEYGINPSDFVPLVWNGILGAQPSSNGDYFQSLISQYQSDHPNDSH